MYLHYLPDHLFFLNNVHLSDRNTIFSLDLHIIKTILTLFCANCIFYSIGINCLSYFQKDN